MLARDGRHGRLQHAVDAVLDDDRIVVGLDMNIGGAAFERGEDRGIDQPDDRADVFFAGQLLDRDVFVGVVFASEHIEREPFAGLVEHALRLLRLLQQIGDLRERGDAGDDAMTEQAGNFVEHHQPRRIAYGDDEHVRLLLDGHEVVAEHQFDGHRAQQVVLNFEVLQIDELGVIAKRRALRHGRVRRSLFGRTNGDATIFESAICNLSSADLAQREDGQVKRDEDEDHDHAHDDEYGRFDKCERRC